MAIKLSVTSKLDGIASWSLQALDTCPGAHDGNGELVPACKGCYARNGNYHRATVRFIRNHNFNDWQRPDWVDDMVQVLDNHRYFRWFDSGDVYCKELALKILAVMTGTPWVKHWLPTRMHKFPKIHAVLEDMRSLPNVSVRYSSDDVDGSYTPGLHGSTIIPDASQLPQGVKLCRAYDNDDARCNGCRTCWDKTVPVVAYVAHGRSMMKVIQLKKAA